MGCRGKTRAEAEKEGNQREGKLTQTRRRPALMTRRLHGGADVVEKRVIAGWKCLVDGWSGQRDTALFNSKEPNTSNLCCGQPRDDVLAHPHGGACAASFIVLESYPNIHSMNTVDHLHRFGMEAGETSVKMREPGGIPHHRR